MIGPRPSPGFACEPSAVATRDWARHVNRTKIDPVSAMKKFICLFFASVMGVTLALAAETAKVTPKDAAKLVAEGKAVVVDCREPSEWSKSGVAAPAVLLPKSDFDGAQKDWKPFLAANAGKQILIYCGTGKRAGTIAAALTEKGLNAGNIGGLKDWTEAGLPTRKVDSAAAAAPKK